MKYYKAFFILLLLVPKIAFSACLSVFEESQVNDFIYDGELIQLALYEGHSYERFEEKKYGGNIFYIDKIIFHGYEVWSGGFSKKKYHDNFGIFYFNKKKVTKLVDANYGFFAQHKDELYVLSFDKADPHATISSLYKVLKTENDLKIKKIFELPGIIEWFDNTKENLIVYGGVNDNPFAASIDSKGEWHKLRYIPRRDSYE